MYSSICLEVREETHGEGVVVFMKLNTLNLNFEAVPGSIFTLIFGLQKKVKARREVTLALFSTIKYIFLQVHSDVNNDMSMQTLCLRVVLLT